MKTKWGLFCAALILLFCCVSTAGAEIGIGPYVDLGGGGGELERDNSLNTWDVGVGAFAVGFALDTAPIGPAVFNYRLNLGLESQVFVDDDNDDYALEMGGVTLENVFGFAVVRRPTLRWWIGPLLRVGAYSGEADTYYDKFSGDLRKVDDAELYEFGIGAATGVNFPIGKSRKMFLAPSAGIRFVGVDGDATFYNYSTGTVVKQDLSGGYTTAFFNFALLF